MKNILIFNDISGLGNCSMCANLPVFTKLGHYCMPIITATFSCQTGFEKFTVQKNGNLPQCARDVLSNRTPSAVYVGFCVDEKLLSEVGEIVKNAAETCSFKQVGSPQSEIKREEQRDSAPNEKPFIFVDPILGDNGKLYSIFTHNYAEKMRSLVKFADCISPNLTEACLLADIDYAELTARSNEPAFLGICGEVFKDFLQKTGAKNAVITGIVCGELIGNIVMQQSKPAKFVTNRRVPVNYSGTGDIFGSVLCGELLNGVDLLTSTEIAANFVCKAATLTTCGDRRFGVDFAKTLELL